MKLSFLGNNSDKTRLSGHSVLGLYAHFAAGSGVGGVGGGVGRGGGQGGERGEGREVMESEKELVRVPRLCRGHEGVSWTRAGSLLALEPHPVTTALSDRSISLRGV